MKKERTKDILQSLDNIERVSPSAQFLDSLESDITARYVKQAKISKMALLMIAASFALLLLANFAVYKNVNSVNSSSYASSLSSENYNLIPTKILVNE